MIKVTRWKPDTCDCIIEYEWDDSTPQDSRVHTFKKFVKSCPHHIGADWSKALQHNQEKNQTITSIKEAHPELLKADGEFADDVIPSWKIEAGQIMVNVDKVTKTGVIKVI